MKVCFFLQRRFAYLGHAMARQLRDIDRSAEFCAFVGSRPSLRFLQNQRDIDYSSLVLEEDLHARLYSVELDLEYLRSLERTYGIPNLWPYLYIDRVLMSGQLVREYPHDQPSLDWTQMLLRLQTTAMAVIDFLEREKPDVVVTSVIGSVGSMLLYHIARKRGIKTIHIEFARIGNRITLTDDYRTFSWVRNHFEEIRSGRVSPKKSDAEQFLSAFRSSPTHYDEDAVPGFYDRTGRLAQLRFMRPSNLTRSVPFHMRALFKDLRRIGTFDYTDIPIWWQLWDTVRRKLRGLRGTADLTIHPDWNKPFAYYPLHIDPEVATMLYGAHYTNQLELIRQVARSLPVGMPLYVKEHPGMVGYRPRRLYKEMLKVPNVRLAHPSVSGLDLARAAALTVTITSTNAWEALLFKRPIITFGDVFFNDIPGVERCRSFEDLPYLVCKQLTEWHHDEEVLVDYLSALLEDSVDADFSALWNRGASSNEVYEDSGMRALARELAKKMDMVLC